MNPYKNEAINRIYTLLFCDDLDLYKEASVEGYPWNILFAEKTSGSDLRKIIDDWDLETRPKILAANRLLKQGSTTDQRRIFCVIIEVGLTEGLDVLAAYEDGTARYINHSEKMIVWETKTEESNEMVVDLFIAARTVVDRTGPWHESRKYPPPIGNARLTFLVSNGLYFGEGPFDVLQRDRWGGPVLRQATKLMNFLIGTSLDRPR